MGPLLCRQAGRVAGGGSLGRHNQPRESRRPLGIVLGEMATDRPALEYLLRREFDLPGKNYTSLR